jgi:DNA-binding protein HU-beta
MTKTELIDKVSEESGLTKKDSGKAIDAVFESITEALAGGDKVQLVGFGSFEVHSREARKGRNPQTGEEILIAATKAPVFKAGKGLKDTVDK